MAEPIRIANCSGFFGDRLSAARERVETHFGPDVHYEKMMVIYERAMA